MNFTNFTNNLSFTEFKDKMLYNPSCLAEMEKFQKFCLDFKVEVINSVSLRFKIALGLLTLFIIFRMYLKYSKPLFTNHKFYLEYWDMRIDFIIMILLIITIGLMFI